MKSKRLLAYVLALAIIVSGFGIPTTANANVLDDARALIKSVSNKIETTAKDKDVKKKTLTVKNKKVLNYKVKSSTKLDKLVFDKTTISNAASISAKCSVVFKNKSKIKKLKAYNDLTLSSSTKSYKIPVESLFLYKSKIKVNSKTKHKLAEIGSKVKSSTLLLQKNVTKVVDRGTKNKITISKCKASDTYMKGKSSSLYTKSATLKSLSLGKKENKAIVKSSTVDAMSTKGTKASVSISSGSSITEYYNTGKENIVRVQDSYVKDYKVGGSKTTHYIKSCKVPKLRLYGTYNTAHVWYPSNMRYRISSSTNKLYIHGYGITGTTSGVIDGVYSGKGGIITIDSINEENNVKRIITVYLDESGKVDRVDERTSDGTDNKTDDDIINDGDDKEDNKNNGNNNYTWWGGGSSSSSGSTPNTPVRPQKQTGTCSIRAYSVEYRQPLRIMSMSSTNGDNNVSYSYKTQGASDSTYTATTPSGIGSYTVKATYAETDTYESCEATADFDIEKMTNTASIGLPDDLVANGVVTDGAFTFSIDNNENDVPIIIQPVDGSVVTGSAVGNTVTINPLKNSNTTVKVIIPEGEFYKATEEEFTVSFRNLAGYYATTGEFIPWIKVIEMDDQVSPTRGFRINDGKLQNIYSTFVGGTLIVDKSINNLAEDVFSGTTLDELELPGSIKNIPCQGGSSYLQKLTLKEGTESIDSMAFQNYTALHDIDLPESLKYIKNSAFSNNSALTSIDLNEGLLEIGDNAFGRCVNLEELNIPRSVTTLGLSPFAGTKVHTLDLSGNIVSVNNVVTYGMPELNTILIGRGVMNSAPTNNSNPNMMSILGDNACANAHVTLSGDIGAIPDESFSNVQFKVLTLSEGITEIGDSAFESNSSLSAVNLPNSLETINNEAFSHNSSLASLNVPANVTYIANNALSMTGMTQLAVATGNAVYDSRDNCNAIMETATDTLVVGTSSTIIPEDTKHIGANAFSGRPLVSIDLSNNYELESIGTDAFSETRASKVYIPETVKSISTGAFNIPHLKVVVPSQCEIIEDNAFKDADVVVYNGNNDISGCGASTIVNGGYLTDDGDFTEWSALGINTATDYSYNSTPTSTQTIDSLIGEPGTLSVPKGISYIGTYNFSSGNNTKRILLPQTVTTISNGAFNSSKINRLYLPDNISAMGTDMFVFSTLKEFNFNNTELTKVPKGTFYGCSELITTTLSDHITEIGMSAFGSSSIQSVYSVNTINKIGDQAFYRSGLRNFEVDTNDLLIDGSAFIFCSNLQSIDITADNLAIGQQAFFQCCNLKNIDIKADDVSIGQGCFMYANETTTGAAIKIDTNTGDIKPNAFMYCYGTSDLSITGNFNSIGESCFHYIGNDNNDLNVSVSGSAVSVGDYAFSVMKGKDVLNVNFNLNTDTFGSNVFCDDGAKCVIFNIETTAQDLGYMSLYSIDAIEKLDIKVKSNMLRIPDHYFAGYSVEDLHIEVIGPIATIGSTAFMSNKGTNSYELILPNSVTTIESAAFLDSNLSEIHLPDGLTSIGSSAFRNCPMNNLVIPDSVTTIGTDAFLNVPHVTYHGSAEGSPWGALSMS